jgi:nicotinamidase-related amidase
MKEAFGICIPQGLSEICSPQRCALVIYDMQVGIVTQIPDGSRVVSGCRTLLEAARSVGMRVFFTRHFFFPNRYSGVGQLRRAMIWQRKTDPSQLGPMITQGSDAWQIVPELIPHEGEVVIDKITMSAFASTFLNLALRDAHLDSFIIAGIALEVGIEPTVRHGLDLNFIPVVASDACGGKTQEACARSLATMNETGEVITSPVSDIVSSLGAR